MLIKSIHEKEDPFLAILNYNVTPKQDIQSPSQLLMGRRLKTTLPTSLSVLQPKYSIGHDRKKLQLRQYKQKQYYKPVKQLAQLEPNQKVLIQQGLRNWTPAKVVEKTGLNDYKVKTEEGTEYRQNRTHLRPYKERVETEEPGSAATNTVPENIQTRPQPDLETPSAILTSQQTTTRSGRIIRAPSKLDL